MELLRLRTLACAKAFAQGAGCVHNARGATGAAVEGLDGCGSKPTWGTDLGENEAIFEEARPRVYTRPYTGFDPTPTCRKQRQVDGMGHLNMFRPKPIFWTGKSHVHLFKRTS